MRMPSNTATAHQSEPGAFQSASAEAAPRSDGHGGRMTQSRAGTVVLTQGRRRRAVPATVRVAGKRVQTTNGRPVTRAERSAAAVVSGGSMTIRLCECGAAEAVEPRACVCGASVVTDAAAEHAAAVAVASAIAASGRDRSPVVVVRRDHGVAAAAEARLRAAQTVRAVAARAAADGAVVVAPWRPTGPVDPAVAERRRADRASARAAAAGIVRCERTGAANWTAAEAVAAAAMAAARRR